MKCVERGVLCSAAKVDTASVVVRATNWGWAIYGVLLPKYGDDTGFSCCWVCYCACRPGPGGKKNVDVETERKILRFLRKCPTHTYSHPFFRYFSSQQQPPFRYPICHEQFSSR